MTEKPQGDKDYILAILHDYPRIRQMFEGKENQSATTNWLGEAILRNLVKDHELERLENNLIYLEQLAQRGKEAYEKQKEDLGKDEAIAKEKNITNLKTYLKKEFKRGDVDELRKLLRSFAQTNDLKFNEKGKTVAGHAYNNGSTLIKSANGCYYVRFDDRKEEFTVLVGADHIEAFYRDLNVPEDSGYNDGNIPWQML